MGKGKRNETTMNIKLAKISLNEYDLLQCLNYWPTSMPSGNISHVALVTPHPKYSLPPLEETFEDVSATNPSLRQPQENVSQLAEGRADTAGVRTKGARWASSTGQEASPQKMQ